MSESNWKVADVSQLIPVGVTLHDPETGQHLNIPTLYNPVTDIVHILDAGLSAYQTVIQAVKTYVKNSVPEPLDDAVPQLTWDNIAVLSGLARPSITQET